MSLMSRRDKHPAEATLHHEESTSYERIAHKAKRIGQRSMLGQRVSLYEGVGFLWKNRDTGDLFHLGGTQSEALKSLEKLLEKPKIRRTEPRADIKKFIAKPDMHRAYWRAYYYACARARRANVPVMGKSEYEDMIRRAAGRCELTGIEFNLERAKRGAKALWSPSIDRVATGRSYTYNNCRIVCVCVNIALNEFGEDVLLRIAKALIEKHQ